jgi:translation initiation factor IF-3
MLYSLKKNLKNKNNSHPVKEIHLTTNIAEHDIETKCTQAKKLLEKGLKVKVILTMKGRELLRREDSKKSLLQFIVKLSDISVPEFSPKDEGNRTIVILKKKTNNNK